MKKVRRFVVGLIPCKIRCKLNAWIGRGPKNIGNPAAAQPVGQDIPQTRPPLSLLSFNPQRGRYVNPLSSKSFKKGINIVGFPFLKVGLGEHLRLVSQALLKAKIDISVHDVSKPYVHPDIKNDDDTMQKYCTGKAPYNVNLFCVNAEFIKNYEHFRGRYAIGYGYHELSTYPNFFLPNYNLLHEYWAPTQFIQKVLSQKLTIPIVHMPIPVDFPMPLANQRKKYKLPQDKFLFIFTFDMASSSDRKNPYAVIRAFKKAFKGKEKVGLVIKLNSRCRDEEHEKDYARILEEIKGIEAKVYIIEETLSREGILELINACDCYVSLHRAEGFGLGLAEAMKMGKPAIGTNYSGNTDFMNMENSCLVHYETVEDKNCYLNRVLGLSKDSLKDKFYWAEADIDHAAYWMAKVYKDEEFRKTIGNKAQKYMDEKHTFKVISENYIERLKLLGLFG